MKDTVIPSPQLWRVSLYHQSFHCIDIVGGTSWWVVGVVSAPGNLALPWIWQALNLMLLPFEEQLADDSKWIETNNC